MGRIEKILSIVDGTQQNGYVFTSDANGFGSWQAPSGGGYSPWDTINFMGFRTVVLSDSTDIVSIGTNEPAAQFYIKQGNSTLAISTDDIIIQADDDLTLRSDNFGSVNIDAMGGESIQLQASGGTGNVGIGTDNPVSKLTVTGGDVYITDISSGVIIPSPDGTCWRLTPDNAGATVWTSITCP